MATTTSGRTAGIRSAAWLTTRLLLGYRATATSFAALTSSGRAFSVTYAAPLEDA